MCVCVWSIYFRWLNLKLTEVNFPQQCYCITKIVLDHGFKTFIVKIYFWMQLKGRAFVMPICLVTKNYIRGIHKSIKGYIMNLSFKEQKLIRNWPFHCFNMSIIVSSNFVLASFIGKKCLHNDLTKIHWLPRALKNLDVQSLISLNFLNCNVWVSYTLLCPWRVTTLESLLPMISNSQLFNISYLCYIYYCCICAP